MSQQNNPWRVWLNNREHKVYFARIYADEYFDIWLQDTQTERFISCTMLMPNVSLKDRQVLVRDEFLELLSTAGVVRPIGETLNSTPHGTLHKCQVPVREKEPSRTADALPKSMPDREREPQEKAHDTLEHDLDDEFEL